MENEIKFTEDELRDIKTIQDDGYTLVSEFGQLEIERFVTNRKLQELDQMREKLEVQFFSVQERERVLVQSLNEKYGSGTVDIESGVFIPNK
jgi:uncharacterized protein with PIN domain